MCFDLDSRPPIAPILGGSIDHETLTLTSADGTAFRAFRARAAEPSGAGIVISPDVRGLHPYYEELALRLAENGVDALAYDYFGRTAGTGVRGDDFPHMEHVQQVTWDGLRADLVAAIDALRASRPGDAAPRSVFTMGFCMGGRLAFNSSALGQGLAGVIAFYGIPGSGGRGSMPAPIDQAAILHGPLLGFFGGIDQAIPASTVEAFDEALRAAGVAHEFVTYPEAPHSFFDKKAADYADASADAWRRTLAFISANTAA